MSHDRKPNTENSPENFTSDQAFAEFKQARNSKGGFGLAQHIFYRGNPITTATGWGNQENMVAFVLGHVNKVKFHDMPNKRIMKQSDYMKM